MSVCSDCGQKIEWYTDEYGRHIPRHQSGYCSGKSTDYLSPSAIRIPCIKCGQRTWLVRSNGGAFWVDQLGPPWPKHPCFDGLGFNGKKPFSVGEVRWHVCDFCSQAIPAEQYSHHLTKLCSKVETLHDSAERQVIRPKSESNQLLYPPHPSTEITCTKCRKTFPESELPHHNWRHHNGPRPHVEDIRRDCNCGRQIECVECGGSGWYIEHYDGYVTPGSEIQ
jgi:hypothetical protein